MGEHEYKVGDKVVITKQGDGCDDASHNTTGGPAVGAVCEIVEIGSGGAPCGNFRVAYEHGYATWWTTSEHFIPGIPTSETSDPEPEPEDSEPATGTVVTSLHPGSTTEYLMGHVRVDGSTLRVQGLGLPGKKDGRWECNTPGVTVKLREFIADRPHTRKSVANTSTMYAPCRMRPDGDKLRVQVAGPPLNRDWGAEFIIAFPDYATMTKLKAQVKAPEPKPEPASTGAPVEDHSPLELSYLAKFGTATPQVYGDVKCKLCGYTWNDHYNDVCPVKLPEYAPKHFTGPKTSLDSICSTCGEPAGYHYPGGDKYKFSPALCPEAEWACPSPGCGKVKGCDNRQPLAIHLAFDHDIYVSGVKVIAA